MSKNIKFWLSIASAAILCCVAIIQISRMCFFAPEPLSPLPPLRYLDGAESDVFAGRVYDENTEIRFINFPDYRSFTLTVENPDHRKLIFPKGVEWAGDEPPPPMTKGQYSIYNFFHVDGDRYFGWAQQNVCGTMNNLVICP